ncbi:MAG TPA: Gldg family protein [Stellaceae bacterium]|nr:Gldg family protein [Stellaceae bacterium]
MALGSRFFAGSRRVRSFAALVCIAVLLLSINVIAARYLDARLDLTDEGLYTLSPGTRSTLAKIDEPITLRFYYSPHLGDAVPAFGVYAQRVRELLDQYVAAAHGKLRLEVYNPLPFSDAEDRAVALGLHAVPLNAEGEQVYFGLVGTNSTDDAQVIPFFAQDRERLLEYDLTKLVHSLANPKRTVVGLMSSLPMQGDPRALMQGRPAEPMAIMDQLNQLDEVRPVPSDVDAIPPGTDVLMIAHPQKLPAKTLFAIDQFVLNGGKALVFVDPYSEYAAARPGEGAAADSDLEPLFKAWGLKMLPKVVAGDRRHARKVSVPVRGGGARPMDYIAWLTIPAAELNRDDPITANLRQITLASAGILDALPDATTNFEKLITTSGESTKIPVEELGSLPDVAGMLARFKPDGIHYVLAARVTGPATSAFPDGAPKPAEAAGAPEPPKPPSQTPALKQSVRPIDVVVVADSDMLDDRFWAQTRDFFGQRVVVPVANNSDFVANAIDVLAGGADLVGLRSRGTSARPFLVVDRIQRSANERYSAEERALEDKLKEAQAKLQGLTGKGEGNAPATLSPEQTRTIEQFRADILTTRRQLRDVQAALRADIQQLKAQLEFFDIALIPILVALVAIVLGLLRQRRRRRRVAYA